MKPQIKKVEVIILDVSAKVKVAKIVRNYSKEPYSNLVKCITDNLPIYKKDLMPEKFYTGIKDVVSLINELDKQHINYLVRINGEDSPTESVFDIYKKVEKFSLKDFR